MLDINTTVPSIAKRNCNGANCKFTASLEMRNSSNVTFVIFSDNIELKKGSRIYVTGMYALGITSQSGNISIQTDINMTCNKESSDTTCLGGSTQSPKPTQIKSFQIFKGQGITFHSSFFFPSFCHRL